MNERSARLFSYENGLMLLLGFSFGVAFFDRNAATYLGPYIVEDLALNNTQLSLLGSGLALSWALGAYLLARLSDATQARKKMLISFLVIFSCASFLSGIAPNYEILLLSRVIMGFVEGPFLPVCLAVMMAESSPHRRGMNAGIMQNLFAALLGQTLAPLVFVPIAEAADWRMAFYVAGIPGLLCAVAVYFFVREPPMTPRVPGAKDASPMLGVLEMLRVHNIWVCSLISIFMVAWLILGWVFLPTFLALDREVAPGTMAQVLAALGIATALSSFGAPALSDRLGRKPVMLVFCLMGVLAPLAILYLPNPIALMTAVTFVGWLGSGAFPLFMGVIPSETISRAQAASAMGLIVCIGEIVGGTGIVTATGWIADQAGRSAAFVVMAACAVTAGVLCLLLEETAPAKRKAGAAQAAPQRAAA